MHAVVQHAVEIACDASMTGSTTALNVTASYKGVIAVSQQRALTRYSTAMHRLDEMRTLLRDVDLAQLTSLTLHEAQLQGLRRLVHTLLPRLGALCKLDLEVQLATRTTAGLSACSALKQQQSQHNSNQNFP